MKIPNAFFHYSFNTQVPSSLNSSYCYILQEGDLFYTWIGGYSTPYDEDLLYQMLDKLSVYVI
jgi:hypothetical protein